MKPSVDILGAVAATDTTVSATEYATLTERCGLVDRSARGKLALTGSGAVEFLNGQVTNELIGLRPGEGCYAAFLTHKGKMLGDLRILAVGEAPDMQPSELLLDTERCALQALFDMIRRFKVGYDVQLHKRTLESGLLSLIGPRSAEIAASALACPQDGAPRARARTHPICAARLLGRARRPPDRHRCRIRRALRGRRGAGFAIGAGRRGR